MAEGFIVKDGSLSLAAKTQKKKKGRQGRISLYYFPLIRPPITKACGNEPDEVEALKCGESVRHQSSWKEMEAITRPAKPAP